MKVYHTSSVIVESPDTMHSRSFLDFGSGFYVTTLEKQAIDYAQRFIIRGHNAYINIYEMCDESSGKQVAKQTISKWNKANVNG